MGDLHLSREQPLPLKFKSRFLLPLALKRVILRGETDAANTRCSLISPSRSLFSCRSLATKASITAFLSTEAQAVRLMARAWKARFRALCCCCRLCRSRCCRAEAGDDYAASDASDDQLKLQIPLLESPRPAQGHLIEEEDGFRRVNGRLKRLKANSDPMGASGASSTSSLARASGRSRRWWRRLKPSSALNRCEVIIKVKKVKDAATNTRLDAFHFVCDQQAKVSWCRGLWGGLAIER